MRNDFLETAEDIEWLKTTHLKGVALPSKWEGFASAIVMGNEDSPEAVKLFLSATPLFDDNYLFVKFIDDGTTYCEYVEYDGKTDQPIRHY